MRMNWTIKTAITLFVLIVFIIMSGTCSYSCAERGNVEADLTKRAKAELEKNGFGHVDVSADHLIVTLKGFVKDKAAKAKAGDIVKTMPMSDHIMGCSGHKVHPLDNQLKVRSAPRSLRWLTQRLNIDASKDVDPKTPGIQIDPILVHSNFDKGQKVSMTFAGRAKLKAEALLAAASMGGTKQQEVRLTIPEDCSPCNINFASPKIDSAQALSVTVAKARPFDLRFSNPPPIVTKGDDVDAKLDQIQYDLLVEHRGLTPPVPVEIFKVDAQGKPTGAVLGKGTLVKDSTPATWKNEKVRVTFAECDGCRYVALAKPAGKSMVLGDNALISTPKPNAATIDKDIKKILALENIEFQSGSASLTRKGANTVNRVSGVLKGVSNFLVAIEGHTDSQGNDSTNQTLSEARARTVKNALIRKGVDKNILSTKGFGETKPVADNSTSQGRARNRRIDFIVTKK